MSEKMPDEIYVMNPSEWGTLYSLRPWDDEPTTKYLRADICDPTNLLKLNAEQGEIIRGLVEALEYYAKATHPELHGDTSIVTDRNGVNEYKSGEKARAALQKFRRQ